MYNTDVPPEMMHFLAVKYGIEQQNANSNTLRARTGGMLDSANAGQVAANAASGRALNAANAGDARSTSRTRDALLPGLVNFGQSQADAGRATATELQQGVAEGSPLQQILAGTRMYPHLIDEFSKYTPDAGSFLSKTLAGIGGFLKGATSPTTGRAPSSQAIPTSSNDLSTTSSVPVGSVRIHGPGETPQQYAVPDDRGYKRGTARVPGKGDGTKDTVKAKLAPGEAVLNKGAADHMGRGLIAALNHVGAQRLGLA